MERKKQFQLQTLITKLNTYQTTLKQLLQQRNDILATAGNINYINNNSLSKKQDLEKQITNTKASINSSKYEINNITNQIKALPAKLQQALDNETTIHNDSLDNINNIIIDEHIKHQENLSNATREKLTLLDNINTTQQNILQQNEKITTLQSTAHNSRKTVLLELHQQKQQRVSLQQQITNITNQNEIYYNHLEQLSKTNTILEQLKIAIINQHYNTETASANNNMIIDLLQQLEMLVDKSTANSTTIENSILTIDLEKLVLPEYINTITTEVNSIITNNTNRIATITAKAERATNKNNNYIKNIISSSTRIIGTARINPIKIKDQYKIEKNKRTELQSILADLQYQYDNHNTLVINKLIDTHNNTLLELDTHKQQSQTRLHIMQERISTEYANIRINLETQLQTIQDNIIQYNKQLQELNTTLNDISNNITEVDKSILELQNLDTKILQLELTIKKIQNDKTILEQQ